jgi:hypothetical protein
VDTLMYANCKGCAAPVPSIIIDSGVVVAPIVFVPAGSGVACFVIPDDAAAISVTFAVPVPVTEHRMRNPAHAATSAWACPLAVNVVLIVPVAFAARLTVNQSAPDLSPT